MIVCKARFTCDTQAEAEKARKYLEGRLQNLRLDAPKVGQNPKYKDNPKVFLYGDILVPEGKEHVPARARRVSRSVTKPTKSVKTTKPAKTAKPPEPAPPTVEKLTRIKAPK